MDALRLKFPPGTPIDVVKEFLTTYTDVPITDIDIYYLCDICESRKEKVELQLCHGCDKHYDICTECLSQKHNDICAECLSQKHNDICE